MFYLIFSFANVAPKAISWIKFALPGPQTIGILTHKKKPANYFQFITPQALHQKYVKIKL